MAKTRARWQTGVTAKDVAEHAGVSPMTVSRVLNNESAVRPAMRAKVLESVKALNYRPNFSARSLAKAKSFFIGLLYDNPSAGYVSEFLDGAVRRCRVDRFHMVLENCGPDLEGWNGRVEEVLAHANVDGVIILPPVSDDDAVIAAVEKLNVPYIRISPGSDDERSPSVGINDYDAAYRMTRDLANMGHKKIGFIKGHPNQGASRDRFEGYLAAMQEQGLDVLPDYVSQGYFDFQSGLDAAETLLQLSDRPTAIFASNDDMAAATMAIARKYDLEIPTDLSVVGFDDTAIAATTWPPLTTVRQPIAKMAEAAVGMLIRKLTDNEEAQPGDENRWLLDCTIVQRDSTAPPKGR